MCRIYSQVDPTLFELQSRSVRMEGQVTSVRLENVFWKILERIAAEEGIKLSTFLSRVYHERLEKFPDVGNFSSLLRVACTTYLNSKMHIILEGGLDAVAPVAQLC